MNYYNSETMLEQQVEIEKLIVECDSLKAQVQGATCDKEKLSAEIENLGRKYNAAMELAQHRSKSIDALMAQVEKLRVGLNQAIELLVTALHEPQQITESEIHDLRTLEKLTPTQCLAERDANVAANAVDYLIDNKSIIYGSSENPFKVIEVDDAKKYANQLRQQAKGGD